MLQVNPRLTPDWSFEDGFKYLRKFTINNRTCINYGHRIGQTSVFSRKEQPLIVINAPQKLDTYVQVDVNKKVQ